MKKPVVMEKKVTPLTTEVITIVKDQCPIESEIFEDFNLNHHCLSCPYVIQGKRAVSHGWYEYKPTTVKERSEREEDDPITDYHRTIPCANCGSDVPFYSSFSCFVQGDDQTCPKCGLLHTFLRFEETKKALYQSLPFP